MTTQAIEVTNEVNVSNKLVERVNSIVDDFQALILEKLDIVAKLPVTAEMFDDETQDSVIKAVSSRLSEKSSVTQTQIYELHSELLEHRTLLVDNMKVIDRDFRKSFKKFNDLVTRHNRQCRVVVDIFKEKVKFSNMSETEIAVALDNDELHNFPANAECSLEVFATVTEKSNLVAYLKYATDDGKCAVTARMIKDFHNIADVEDVFCDLDYKLYQLKADYSDALSQNNFEEVEYIQSRIDSISI